MANYPQNIQLPNNSVIVELTDDTSGNVSSSANFGFGYVRQIGLLVYDYPVDCAVQFDLTKSVLFTQEGISFAVLNQQYIFFKQVILL